jgi:hypothetical protein
MGKELHLDFGIWVLVLLSIGNIVLVTATFIRPENEPSASQEHPSSETILYGNLGLGLACSSQILYLAFAVAWQFKWMHSYPGNPVDTYGILVGLLLSAGAFVAASMATGCRRFAGIFVAIATGGLWLLSAIASVAI